MGTEKKNFINYRASAGSGKTYQLVLEYLALALIDEKGENFKHILAITFTNKAAAEMKERILKSLKTLSKGKNEELKNNLIEREPLLKNIDRRAGKALKKILHNYSNFAVTTIDSFISRLVRSFTYETDIPAGFDVELNLTRMNNFVIKNLFSEIGTNRDTTDIIVQFALDRINRGRSWNVETSIIPILSEINRERKEQELEKVAGMAPGDFIRVSDELKKIFMEYSGKMKQLGEKGIMLISRNDLSPADFPYGYSGAAGYLNKLSRITPFSVSETQPSTRFLEGKWEAGNSSEELQKKLQGIFGEELNELREEIIDLYEKKFKTAFSAFLIFENIYLLGLIGRIREYLNEYKSEYNVVPIYDLTKNVHRIIRDGDIPFIYYILGDSFEHIMIDEFQDTSQMQWDSLFPLIENSVSVGKINLGVGDLKQSIYRWRGGDTNIMNKSIHEQFSPWGGVDSRNLPNNFRSRELVVGFNNLLFNSIKTVGAHNEFISRIYADPAQKSRQIDGGFVSLRLLNKKENIQSVPEQVEGIVKDCLNAGFSLSDIAVLTRKKAPGMEIAAHLISEGHSIITPELLVLYKNPVALFLIDLLKYTADQSLDHILANILFFISKYMSETLWNETLTGRYFTDKASVELPPPVKQFIESEKILNRIPVYEAVEELIRLFDLKNSLNSASAGFITAFLDMVMDHSKKEGGGIPVFIEWWDEYGTEYSVPTPETSNGVTLMTIHKAKGLEFPVVIVPYVDWREKNEKNLWLNPDTPDLGLKEYSPPYFIKGKTSLEESLFVKEWQAESFRSELDNLNLLYVACTRAQEALFIFTDSESPKKPSFKNGQLLRNISRSDFFDLKEAGRVEKGVLEKSLAPPEERSFQTITDRDLISTSWTEKITIRKQSDKFWDIQSNEQLKKIDRGIIIHEILSMITSTLSAEQIIEQMVYSGRISAINSREISDLINKMFEIEEVRGWFYGEGEFLTEQPILTKSGSFRPDRIIIKNHSVLVVDFKTGRETDADIDQMNKYKSLILDMGYKNVKGLLFYLGTNSIKEV